MTKQDDWSFWLIGTRADSAEKRRRLLEAGMTTMYAHGYHGTGVQEITDAAGVPKGSFYNYFESKESFTAEIVQLYAERLHSYATGILTELLPPRERILKLYDGLVLYYESDVGRLSQGCFAGNVGQEMIQPPIGAAVLDFFQAFREPIARCIREAQEQGTISDKTNAGDLADFITDSYQGALMRMKLRGSAAPLRQFRGMLESILS